VNELKFFFALLTRFYAALPTTSDAAQELIALVDAFKQFLSLLEPVAPHISTVLLEMLGKGTEQSSEVSDGTGKNLESSRFSQRSVEQGSPCPVVSV
jgi:leucyl-tRNA synthetase